MKNEIKHRQVPTNKLEGKNVKSFKRRKLFNEIYRL